MAEAKFTKGEWYVEKHDNGAVFVSSIYAGRGDICDLYHKQSRDDNDLFVKDNAEANAYLIAAAPDLYEALEFMEINQPFQGTGEWFQFMDRMKLALAKARGQKND